MLQSNASEGSPSSVGVLIEVSERFFKPTNFWIFVYYVAIPILTPIGFISNFVGVRVIFKKFSNEIGFKYQALIMIIDSIAIGFLFLTVAGYFWGIGRMAIAPKAEDRTAFWFERSYFRVWILAVVFDPARHFLTTVSSYLIIGIGIDRIIALMAPVYYNKVMNRRLAFAVMFLVSLILAFPVGANIFSTSVKTVYVNTSDTGIILVYKRGSAFSRGHPRPPIIRFFDAAHPTTKFVAFFGVVTISIIVSIVYRKKFWTNPNRTGPESAQQNASSGSDSSPIQHAILTRLLLTQCFLVALCSLPHVKIRTRPLFPFVPITMEMTRLRDLGQAMQISLNAFFYAGVSRRFRKAVVSYITGKEEAPAHPSSRPGGRLERNNGPHPQSKTTRHS